MASRPFARGLRDLEITLLLDASDIDLFDEDDPIENVPSSPQNHDSSDSDADSPNPSEPETENRPESEISLSSSISPAVHIKSSAAVTFLLWLVLVFIGWHLYKIQEEEISDIIRPPPPLQTNLGQFRRSRNLKHYLDNIQLVIEPSSLPCTNLEEVPVLVLVATAPTRKENRNAIRDTWAKQVPTYFVLGLDENRENEQLIDIYMESKQFGDMVVYDLTEHYQNLTLKTALMMTWTLDRCPETHFLYKTDDDMLLNPWVLKKIIKERGGYANLIGYVRNNSVVHRDEHNRWYLARWLFSEDTIPQYMTGLGYLISGDYLRKLLTAAYRVPLHNLEDVYFTYNVAKKTLGCELYHDSRMSPFRPWPSWLPLPCAYWSLASVHSLTPTEIRLIWSSIKKISERHEKGETVCYFYQQYLEFFVMSVMELFKYTSVG